MSTKFGEMCLMYPITNATLQHEAPVRCPRARRLVATALSATILMAAGCSSHDDVGAQPLPSPTGATEAAPFPADPDLTTEAAPTLTPTDGVTPTEPTPTSMRPEPTRKYDAVYFQPPALAHSDESLPGAYIMTAEPGKENSWTSTEECGTENADNFLEHAATAHADRVIGFSLGRRGLPYMLKNMSLEQQRQIDYAIVVDPGNVDDMSGPCELLDTSTLILRWLGLATKAHPKHLVIIAGERTAEDDFQGIYAKYASGIAGTNQEENQVTVCANTTLNHYETWERSRGLLYKDPITRPGQCPAEFSTGFRLQR